MADERPTLLMVEDDLGLQKQMRWSFDRYNVVFIRFQHKRFTPSTVQTSIMFKALYIDVGTLFWIHIASFLTRLLFY